METNDKYKIFLDNLFDDTPDFMKLRESDDNYLILDRFVLGISDKAMPWLFKVYLEQQYNILKNDKFTMSIKSKYPDFRLKVLDINGNLFFNLDGLYVILKELEDANQIYYCTVEKTFKLI